MLRSPQSHCSGYFGGIVSHLYLIANGTVMKTRPTGCVFWYKHSERRKAKQKEVMFSKKLRLILTHHHDVSAPLHHLKVLFKLNLSFTLLLLCALCSAAKFCCCNDWLKFYENLGWAAEMAASDVTLPQLLRSAALALCLQLRGCTKSCRSSMKSSVKTLMPDGMAWHCALTANECGGIRRDFVVLLPRVMCMRWRGETVSALRTPSPQITPSPADNCCSSRACTDVAATSPLIVVVASNPSTRVTVEAAAVPCSPPLHPPHPPVQPHLHQYRPPPHHPRLRWWHHYQARHDFIVWMVSVACTTAIFVPWIEWLCDSLPLWCIYGWLQYKKHSMHKVKPCLLWSVVWMLCVEWQTIVPEIVQSLKKKSERKGEKKKKKRTANPYWCNIARFESERASVICIC